MVQFSAHPIPHTLHPVLSRQHRAWIALYSLQNPAADRQLVLWQNQVTEADLREHQEGWHKLRLAPVLRRR